MWTVQQVNVKNVQPEDTTKRRDNKLSVQNVKQENSVLLDLQHVLNVMQGNSVLLDLQHVLNVKQGNSVMRDLTDVIVSHIDRVQINMQNKSIEFKFLTRL